MVWVALPAAMLLQAAGLALLTGAVVAQGAPSDGWDFASRQPAAASAEAEGGRLDRLAAAESLVQQRLEEVTRAKAEQRTALRLEAAKRAARHRRAAATPRARSDDVLAKVGAARVAEALLVEERDELRKEIRRWKKLAASAAQKQARAGAITNVGPAAASLLSTGAEKIALPKFISLVQGLMLLVFAAMVSLAAYWRYRSSESLTSPFFAKGMPSMPIAAAKAKGPSAYGSTSSIGTGPVQAKRSSSGAPPGVVDDEELLWHQDEAAEAWTKSRQPGA
mmetsp:Transcript_23482/g.41958  ORF Transcript_23482/g.41958 Transcript_23482/m.41958 type:complete len:279 (+) Transcript_23482:144-980(+)